MLSSPFGHLLPPLGRFQEKLTRLWQRFLGCRSTIGIGHVSTGLTGDRHDRLLECGFMSVRSRQSGGPLFLRFGYCQGLGEVRRGEDGGNTRFDPARFTADVIAALR